MTFSPLFHLLQQEGFITRSCIYTGLTEIRNANLGDKGRYYTAFFQLAIGLERLAKLALILDHMVSNNLAPPGAKTIKGYSHDLIKLYSAAEAVGVTRNYGAAAGQLENSLYKDRILKFLSDFAKGARYANLDALASGTQTQEPLAEWATILNEVVESDVSKAKRSRISLESLLISEMLRNASHVQGHDLQNQPLTLESWFSQPRLLDEAARHVAWHLVLIARPLTRIVSKLSDQAADINRSKTTRLVHIPNMREFYYHLNVERPAVLRKKRWP